VEILNEQKFEFKIIEYMKQGFTEHELTKLSKKLNLRFKDFIRTKDQNVKVLDLENDTEVLNAIINHPKIIERPIIVHKEKAIIARPAELLYDFLLNL
tara:strand:+ start:139 stop:432 length:294 start_codon:yes stop_codon:yes gene_type:complete